MTGEVRWAQAARAADVSQAAYFRASLIDERSSVVADRAGALARLHDLSEGDKVVGFRGMARARWRVRELEQQGRELDRMIAALDRRFSALWSINR